jgi:hypothetical protein
MDKVPALINAKANPKRIIRLGKKGSTPRKNPAIEFYVYCPTKGAAQKIRVLVRKAGFHVELISDRSAGRWICLSLIEMLPLLKEIRKRFWRFPFVFLGVLVSWR